MIRFRWPKAAVNGRVSDDGLVIVLRGAPGATHQARRAIDMMVPGLPRSVVGPLELLTSELVDNCVKHGNAGSDGHVRLDVSTPDGVVRVTVTDYGSGFETRQPVRDPHGVDGFGLLIVDCLAKRWGVTRGGRSVWFEIERRV